MSEVASCVSDVIDDPRLYAHVTRRLHSDVNQIYETVQTKRRKRKRAFCSDMDDQPPEVAELQKKLDVVQLRSAS